MDFHDEASQREKCYTTLGQLPAFVDPKQPPSKKSPFSAILGHPFIHTVRPLLFTMADMGTTLLFGLDYSDRSTD